MMPLNVESSEEDRNSYGQYEAVIGSQGSIVISDRTHGTDLERSNPMAPSEILA